MKLHLAGLIAVVFASAVYAQAPSVPEERTEKGSSAELSQSTPENTFALYRKLSLRHRSAVITEVLRPKDREQEAYVFCRIPLGGDRDDAYDLLKMCRIENEWVITGISEADRVFLARLAEKKQSEADAASAAEDELSEDGKMLAALDAMQGDLNERTDGSDAQKNLEIIKKKLTLCKGFLEKYESSHMNSPIIRRIRKMQSGYEEMLKLYNDSKKAEGETPAPKVKNGVSAQEAHD